MGCRKTLPREVSKKQGSVRQAEKKLSIYSYIIYISDLMMEEPTLLMILSPSIGGSMPASVGCVCCGVVAVNVKWRRLQGKV